MVGIVMALYILLGISSFFEYRLLQDALNGVAVTAQAAQANDSRQSLIAIVTVIANIISVVTFIMWFRRAYYNLHLKADYLSYTEGWAAGAWFVPFINLLRPFKIMKELYEKTDEILEQKSRQYSNPLSTAYLGLWWTLWIINGIVDRIDFKMGMNAETLEELTNSSVVSTISCGIGIPLALITIKIISDYSRTEPLLFDLKEIPETQDLQPKIDDQDLPVASLV